MCSAQSSWPTILSVCWFFSNTTLLFSSLIWFEQSSFCVILFAWFDFSNILNLCLTLSRVTLRSLIMTSDLCRKHHFSYTRCSHWSVRFASCSWLSGAKNQESIQWQLSVSACGLLLKSVWVLTCQSGLMWWSSLVPLKCHEMVSDCSSSVWNCVLMIVTHGVSQ